MPPSKRIRTPQFLSARWSSHGEISKRIKIDQPIERPIRLQKRDVVRWHQVRQSPWWMILHRRGTYRPKIGEDQLEARAVSKAEVRGTLPERIIFKYLVVNLKLTDGIEFDFQSSLQGGRLQLGGIVVDFTFPMWGFAIQVDGPTHLDFRRMAKDTEQEMALEAMGYRVFRIAEDVVYDEYQLEEWMRRTFNLALGLGGTGYSSQDVNSLPTSTPQFDLDSVFSLIWELNVRVDNLYRELMI